MERPTVSVGRSQRRLLRDDGRLFRLGVRGVDDRSPRPAPRHRGPAAPLPDGTETVRAPTAPPRTRAAGHRVHV